jgi:SulP family sulfate permease
VLGRVGAHDYVSVERFANAATLPGVLVLRPEEPLFFANAEPLLAQARQRVLTAPDTRLVVFSLEASPDLDSTALEALEEFCSWLSARDGEFRLARLKERAREALMRAKLAHLPTMELDYPSVDDAVRGQGVSPNQLLTT